MHGTLMLGDRDGGGCRATLSLAVGDAA